MGGKAVTKGVRRDVLGKDQGQSLLVAWKGNVLEQKWTLQSLGIEEAQRTNDLVIAGPGELLFLNQKQLVATNLLGSQLIGRTMKMLGECSDVLQVQSNGASSVVAPLESQKLSSFISEFNGLAYALTRSN